MTSLSLSQSPDPRGNPAPRPRTADPTLECANGKPDVSFRDSSNQLFTAGRVNEPRTTTLITQPPTRRERRTVEAFELHIRTDGEAQARLTNLQAVAS